MCQPNYRIDSQRLSENFVSFNSRSILFCDLTILLLFSKMLLFSNTISEIQYLLKITQEKL